MHAIPHAIDPADYDLESRQRCGTHSGVSTGWVSPSVLGTVSPDASMTRQLFSMRPKVQNDSISGAHVHNVTATVVATMDTLAQSKLLTSDKCGTRFFMLSVRCYVLLRE